MKKTFTYRYLTFLSLWVLCLFFSQHLRAQASFNINIPGNNATSSGGNCYVLTPDVVWQQGTAWCNTPINLSQPFNIEYNLNFGTTDGGADGIAFVIQNQGTLVAGTAGQGIGYQGIMPSVIVEFDDFQNGFDPAADHVGITLNGDPDHTTPANSVNPNISLPFNIEDGLWHAVRINWNPATHELQVYFDCILYITYTNDIVTNIFGGTTNAYWGFTSATGAATNLQQFCYAPPLTFTVTPTNVACKGQCNGSASVTNVTGGSGPYNYLWDNGQASATATGLCPGTNTVTVTSSLGCVTSQTVAITEPTALTFTTTQTNPTCFGSSNGSASVTPAGATSPYTYAWTPPPQVTPSISGIAAGNFSCTITDAKGCTQTATFTITDPPAMTGNINVTAVSCFGGNNGSASMTPGGGTSPYTYTWSSSAQTTSAASGMAAGNFSCTITDAKGCTHTETFTITEPTVVTAAINNIINVSCFGGKDGAALASGNGGTGAFTYLWNTNPVQSSATATNLGIGNYQATVSDANGCTATATMTITEPGGMNIPTSSNPASCGINDGSASVTPSGGTGPYTYLWLTNPVVQTTPTASNLTAGTYSVIVTDSKGCLQTQAVTIKGGVPPVADFYFSPDPVSLLEPEVTFLDASGSGVISAWTWHFGDISSGANDSSYLENPSHTYSDSGTYCVTLIVTNASGLCKDTATKCFHVDALSTFYVPNAFTPNHDGKNEIFMAYGTYISEFHMYIFDRWGNLVFESNDINKGWNGTINNKGSERVQEDVYVWKIKLRDSNQKTHDYLGHVALTK